jgi:hypothetical protein
MQLQRRRREGLAADADAVRARLGGRKVACARVAFPKLVLI